MLKNISKSDCEIKEDLNRLDTYNETNFNLINQNNSQSQSLNANNIHLLQQISK